MSVANDRGRLDDHDPGARGAAPSMISHLDSTSMSVSAPTPMVPHVCMSCGWTRSISLGWSVPYCPNHGPSGLPMMPWPLDRLRSALASVQEHRPS